MHEPQTSSHRLEYFNSARRQSRLFAFFLTALFFGFFLVISYYLSWATEHELDFSSELTLAVDLGNSSAGTNIDFSHSLTPSSSTQQATTNVITTSTTVKESFQIDKNPAIGPNDEIVKLPGKKEKVIENLAKEKTPPKPKALFQGKSNVKNNNASSSLYSDKSGSSSGAEKLGRSDGVQGGSQDMSANGLSVKGNLRNRKIMSFPSFKENFAENAVIRVEVRVSSDGNVHFIKFGNSTTTNSNLHNIVKSKLQMLKFVPSANDKDSDQFGTLEFRLRVSN